MKPRAIAYAVFVMVLLTAVAASEIDFGQLRNTTGKFSFAIFADPQVGPINSSIRTFQNARRTLILGIEETNNTTPQPLFAVALGDIVNVPDEPSLANFEDCIEHAAMPVFLVHGNHEARPPYKAFRACQQRVNGMDEVFYSFDVGHWHFIVTPCNLDRANRDEIEAETAMLAWLQADLEANKDRPIMFFNHLHLMPQGLSQLEWYAFRLALRQKLLNLLTRYGNVKYYFNGHVHNGIKASIKLSCEYQGIRFITVPTIVEGRNFGEEFPRYEHGLSTGGYYMLVHVDGDTVTLEGRLAGVNQGYIYPTTFRQVAEQTEPRWFRKAIDLPPIPELLNGSFEQGLQGWNRTYRYQADENPAFVIATSTAVKKDDATSAYLQAEPKGRTFWARDDYVALYQMVGCPDTPHILLKTSYYLPRRPQNAGGFIRINAVADDGFKFLMMFHWGSNQHRADYLPRCFGYEIFGVQQSWAFLQQLAANNKAFFWTLPGDPKQWHQLSVNIPQLHDATVGNPGAFGKLDVTKLYIQIGVWTNPQDESGSYAYVDAVDVIGATQPQLSTIDQVPLKISEWTHLTSFGQELLDNAGFPKIERFKGQSR